MNKLFSKIEKEKLSTDEKAKILSALQNFVNENPIYSIRSPFYNEWFVFKQKMFIIPIAITLILILSSSTVFAAKNSLPGDILYPIKMLDEKVESLTAISPKAQAQVEVAHAISRLDEVEKIVASGSQLSSTTKEDIQNKFGEQVQEAMKNINKLKKSGQTEQASKIQNDFENSIAKHKGAVIELVGGDTGNATSSINFQIQNSKNSERSRNNKEQNKNSGQQNKDS